MEATAASRVRTGLLSETTLLLTTLAAFAVYQVGGQIDAWYHAHYGFEIESFATWPHALLYGGWLASGVPAAVYFLQRRTLPAGYPLVIAGAVAFGVGGAFDMAWHATLGFEVGHEALVSPSHLVLIYSAGASVLGLVWAAVAWRARASGAPRAVADIAISLALAILLRNLLFGFLYSEPLRTDYASGGAVAGRLFGFGGIAAWGDMTAQVAGTTGTILYAALLALVTVVPLRRLRLGGGSLATIVVWSGAMAFVTMPEMAIYVPAVLASALVGEALYAAMGRGALGGRDGRHGYWAIAFALPATQIAVYFVVMATAGGGVAWPATLWAGTPILAGIYGLVACAFAIPPAFLGER